MIRSMTGYGHAEGTIHNRNITVELRSVNNRFLDCSIKLPRIYAFTEEAIKTRVQRSISRGKVDVYISIDSSKADGVSIQLNEPMIAGYLEALRLMRDTYALRDDLSISVISRFPEVFRVEKERENLEDLAEDICTVLDSALADFKAMREREGALLAEDLQRRTVAIDRLVREIEARSPQTVAEYRAKLFAHMQEILADTQIEESRILTEAAIFADRVAVNEELVRIRSHLSQLEHLLKTGGIVGRKLDFLVQELHREANTIGSKGNDLEISRSVMSLKAEIEKIREQSQNIE